MRCKFGRMKLRFRLLGAFFALIGLLTFSVEGVWAATCATNMEAESATSSVEQASQAQSCSVDAAASRANDADLPNGNDSGSPHCPRMPMDAAGTCGAALALPAAISPQLISTPPELQLAPRTDRVPELLLARAFFRPPIA